MLGQVDPLRCEGWDSGWGSRMRVEVATSLRNALHASLQDSTHRDEDVVDLVLLCRSMADVCNRIGPLGDVHGHKLFYRQRRTRFTSWGGNWTDESRVRELVSFAIFDESSEILQRILYVVSNGP